MPEEPDLKLHGAPFKMLREPPLCQRGVLTFRWLAPAFEGMPFRAFKPRGLMIWNAPPMATVRCQITNVQQVAVSFDWIPARWFATAQSFEQLAKQLEKGKEPPEWCTWSTLFPMQTVRIELLDYTRLPLGPEQGIELVMWGYVNPP